MGRRVFFILRVIVSWPWTRIVAPCIPICLTVIKVLPVGSTLSFVVDNRLHHLGFMSTCSSARSSVKWCNAAIVLLTYLLPHSRKDPRHKIYIKIRETPQSREFGNVWSHAHTHCNHVSTFWPYLWSQRCETITHRVFKVTSDKARVCSVDNYIGVVMFRFQLCAFTSVPDISKWFLVDSLIASTSKLLIFTPTRRARDQQADF